MKKVYEKPMIMFESFSLSTNIAGDCDIPTGTAAYKTCAIDFSGTPLFLTTISECVGTAENPGITVPPDETGTDGVFDSGVFDSFCYHVPAENLGYFNS